jgi:hypothetical protein
VAVDSLIVGAFTLLFACGSFAESRKATSLFSKITGGPETPLAFAAFLQSFGSVWWEKLVPLQRDATFLAWPGVSWESEKVPL